MKSVSELVLSVQDRISLPITDEDRFDRPAVVRIFNEVISEQVTPKLIQEGGEYLVHRLVLPLTTAGLPTYPNLRIPMPKRAYGRALREIKYAADAGSGAYNVWDEINVTATSVAEADTYERQGWSQSAPMVCIVNDHIRLLGNPDSATGAIVLYYYLEISDIVDKTTEFAAISDISFAPLTSITTFTAAAGAEYGTFQADGIVKFVDIYRNSTGAILRPDVRLTRTAASTFTTTDLTANDVKELATYQSGGVPVVLPQISELYFVPAGQSQFSTIPDPFDSILVLETSSRILESLGDMQGLEVVARMLVKAYDSITVSMGNRISGQQKKVVDNRNIASVQRGYGRRYR